MKLSVELYTLSTKFGDFKAVETVKEAGFDAIDYSYYWENEKEEVLGDGYKQYAESLKKHLDEVGIECNQAHAPFSLEYGCRFDETDKKYLYLVHSIESAAILGAENIIVHALGVPKDVDLKEYNVEFYRSLVPYCKKFGINVAVENLFEYDKKRRCFVGRFGSPAELNDMVETIDSERITACIDVGHASLTGYEPEDFIADVNPHYLKALHIQDNDYLGDRHILPYLGCFNWNAVMTALKKVGYDGYLTFEIFNYLSRFPEELALDALKFAVAVGKHLISIYNKQ